MKLTYRITTVIFLVLIFLTAITDITRMDFVAKPVKHLGYPDYLPIMIGLGKLIGIILLSIPKYSRFKEWAYCKCCYFARHCRGSYRECIGAIVFRSLVTGVLYQHGKNAWCG